MALLDPIYLPCFKNAVSVEKQQSLAAVSCNYGKGIWGLWLYPCMLFEIKQCTSISLWKQERIKKAVA
jgi:hypothetical protein